MCGSSPNIPPPPPPVQDAKEPDQRGRRRRTTNTTNSGTLLTGPSGVAPGTANLGGSTLLGG